MNSQSSLARSVTDLSLDPGRIGQEAGGKLLVEMRHVRATVGSEDQLAAWNNVRDLMKSGAIKEKDAVDVYVMGGTVDDLDGNPRIEGRYRNVRITSIDYQQMIGRAKRLTLGLYDDLKEAPFLRQYRADVAAAAEEAAAAEAAAVAEAAAAAEEAERLQASAHDHHDEHHDEAHAEEHHDAHGHEEHAHDDRAHHGPAKPHDAHAKDAHGHHDDHAHHGPTHHAAAPTKKPAMKSTRFRNAAQ